MVAYAWQAMARVQKFKGIFGYVGNSRSAKDRGEKEGREWEWERFYWVYSLSVRWLLIQPSLLFLWAYTSLPKQFSQNHLANQNSSFISWHRWSVPAHGSHPLVLGGFLSSHWIVLNSPKTRYLFAHDCRVPELPAYSNVASQKMIVKKMENGS